MFPECSYIINSSLPSSSAPPGDPSDPGGDTVGLIEDLPERIYARIWLLRQLSMLVCLCITGYTAYKFVDYNKVNNRLLEDIRKQNAELKQRMELMQVDGRRTNAGSVSVIDGPEAPDFHLRHLVDEGTGMDGGDDADADSDDDDTLSFNSTMTDGTWLAADNDHDTLERTQLSDVSEDEEEQDLLDEMAFISANSSPMLPELPGAAATPPAAGGRLSRSSRASTPAIRSSYNLRSRAGATTASNPILNNESEEDFYRIVSKMHHKSRVREQ